MLTRLTKKFWTYSFFLFQVPHGNLPCSKSDSRLIELPLVLPEMNLPIVFVHDSQALAHIGIDMKADLFAETILLLITGEEIKEDFVQARQELKRKGMCLILLCVLHCGVCWDQLFLFENREIPAVELRGIQLVLDSLEVDRRDLEIKIEISCTW